MSTTMTIASILPTPPNSPLPSARKPAVTPISFAAALPATLSSQFVEGAQASTLSRSPSAANAISTTNTISTQQTTATKPLAAGKPPPRTLAALKRDLHIDGWQCGAQTLRGTECKRFVVDDKKDLIDAQLASMTGLTRASPDFEFAVLELVMLVHCHQHDAGRPKEHRLETWRLAFPPGSTEGNVREVPVERLIRKALEPLSAKCIAHGNGGACEGRIGGWKVQNCERTIQELIKQEIYSDDAKLEFLLMVLEWNRTCNIHQSSEQFTWVVAWKRNIMAVLPLPIPRSDQTVVSNAPNEPQTSSRAQPDPRIVKTSLTGKRAVPITQAIAQVSPNPRAPPCPTISPGVDPALYWPKAYDLSRFNILPHANQDRSPTHSHKLIRAEISRLLDARDLRNGYVYSYEVEGNEGYVKIGYTTRTLKQRHDDWSFDCNRQTKPLYPFPAQAAAAISNAEGAAAAPAVLIPHARRVEALCHAELDHRRIRIYCNACLKQHIEWFEVSAIEVTAVIQKWSRWVSTQPYELLQLRSKSKWKLKAIEVQRTSKFEQFMREIAVVPASP